MVVRVITAFIEGLSKSKENQSKSSKCEVFNNLIIKHSNNCLN